MQLTSDFIFSSPCRGLGLSCLSSVASKNCNFLALQHILEAEKIYPEKSPRGKYYFEITITALQDVQCAFCARGLI
jgi:hypothetical protein